MKQSGITIKNTTQNECVSLLLSAFCVAIKKYKLSEIMQSHAQLEVENNRFCDVWCGVLVSYWKAVKCAFKDWWKINLQLMMAQQFASIVSDGWLRVSLRTIRERIERHRRRR